jgi:V/A-type H+-transporting ATPase subunit E
VRVSERDVTLDLSDRAVAALLLQHLQPRFRAILEGVVR